MKLSVFTVVTPDLSPEQLADAAKAAGLHGIEWRFKGTPAEVRDQAPSFWGNNLCSIDPELSDEETLQFKQVTESRGLVVAGLTPYLNNLDLAETEHAFRKAKLIGAAAIRVGVAGYDGSTPYPELYEKTVRYLKEAEQMAKQFGVKGLVETHHNTISPSASLAHRLVSHCDSDHIGVLFDPGNMVHEGYEHWRMGLELLGPYLAHVHVKNTGWFENGQREDGTVRWESRWAPLAAGSVDFAAVLKHLKAVGYDGWLGVEDFSKQYGSEELLREFVKFVQERV
ncbi:sugar phosphate isomerase/epimerase family protein [Paenibacillus koleovorans]|uniref:sugar phosphate isomerase/epimerase family protein n=1 Tax=Paenibacillus koleovorans TaxID=121608 RepID=UPI000FD824D4|nr:sugar phosphate isomerase/epimerase family protein [Paenibacillus koleovorans]